MMTSDKEKVRIMELIGEFQEWRQVQKDVDSTPYASINLMEVGAFVLEREQKVRQDLISQIQAEMGNISLKEYTRLGSAGATALWNLIVDYLEAIKTKKETE